MPDTKEDFTPREAGMLSELLGKIIRGRTVAEMMNDPDMVTGEEFDKKLKDLRNQVAARPAP